MATKIATCCYCGTRAALVLDKERHELVCSSCGAPLHNMKSLKSGSADPMLHSQPRKGKKGKSRPDGQSGAGWEKPHKAGYKKKKKKKSLGRSLFEEAFDLIEDIFD
ncbi:hypothetical protein [Pacificoceanicola onchidii]|uniref:hypothetical protein n=1 Tax=Pacificoceanicola onchidii TaxID=2562685 RepID=UPI0010A6AB58|nr:hypothetical protein [Pacificoceanicola onchidii]